MKVALVLGLCLLASLAAADVVTNVKKCDGVDASQCTVGEVRIDPCNKKKFCRLKRGRDASLSFDFTPNFTGSDLKTAAYSNGIIFDTLGEANACELATCPFVPGTKNTLNYNLHIGKLLPKGNFPLTWKIWNAANPSEMCCFEIKIALL